ncbi:MAG: DUF1549 domain-containing protein, partial [Verrucomicrobiales bacterium]
MKFPSRTLFLSASLLLGSMFCAADEEKPAPQNDLKVLPDVTPVLSLDFEAAPIGSLQGGAKVDKLNLKHPEYPDFPENNRSLNLPGTNDALKITDSDLGEDKLRFKNGETITIEAWVRLDSIQNGSYTYLIGKGRNNNPKFTQGNQNWALRLQGHNGMARPTFLFRSAGKNPDWHRWVSTEGFLDDGGWHHVAVTYTFGKPDSIHAFVDGAKLEKGEWDMGGKTTDEPVNDADFIMVGTGNGGGGGNTLRGALDEVKVYRSAVPDPILASRYAHVPPPSPIDPDKVPAGKVLVELCDRGVPAANAWPRRAPVASESYLAEHFAFPHIPHKYIDTGIRADRHIPYILRASSKITLPAGKHRFLLRGRNSARLTIDGKKLIQTAFIPGDRGGQGLVSHQDNFLDLGDPDFRFVPTGNTEGWCEFETKGGEHFIIMDLIVGGKTTRPEPGEGTLAISLEGTQTWQVLSPTDEKVAYTDEAFPKFAEKLEARVDKMNAERRAAALAEHDDYWNKRREIAKDYLAKSEDIPVPAPSQDYPAHNAIDHFLNARIVKVSEQQKNIKKDGVHFYDEVYPILKEKCFSCHQGEKAKGDLRLDTLAAAIEGGEFDGPAIEPGDAEHSALIDRIREDDPEAVMPPKGDPLSKEPQDTIARWINEGAVWPEVDADYIHLTELSDDLTFLRRVYLDTVGVPPTLDEIRSFTENTAKDKRAQVIDQLLEDPRWADNWMGYWQDLLAENPNILNPTLNNTGPFRWWIHEALLDDKPMDLFATELLRMRGSERFGGPAGFATATQNDVPMAAKGMIVSAAFLGVEMKCARCHDSPTRSSLQKDLFALGAMMQR